MNRLSLRYRAPANLVSHIMPVWRPDRSWLLEAVHSVLDQRGCETELLVVDDGCPEPVEELLCAVSDPRLRVIRVPHGGSSHARNAGIREARGIWFRFVDSDDRFPAWSTAHLLQLCGGDQSVISYGVTLSCDAGLNPTRRYSCDLEGDAVVPCLLGRFTVLLPSLLFSRSVVESTGPWDTSLVVSQDWDFVLRALEHGVVRGDRQVVSWYREHYGSASHSGASRGLSAARRVVAKYFDRHPEQRGGSIGRRAERMLEVLSLTQSSVARQWWRRSGFWRAVLARPRIGLAALPALLRSSVPRPVAALVYRFGRQPRHAKPDLAGEHNGTHAGEKGM